MLYEIKVPLTGCTIFRVEASNKADVVEKVLNAEAELIYDPRGGFDRDYHNWIIEHVSSA